VLAVLAGSLMRFARADDVEAARVRR